MMEQALSGSYDLVKNEIVRVLLEGHEKARQAVERERLKARIGRWARSSMVTCKEDTEIRGTARG